MSTTVKTWTEWLISSRFSYMTEEQKVQTLNWLFSVRDKVLERAKIKEGDTFVDIGTGTGLLAFGAYEILKNSGKVIASDFFDDCLEECKKIAEACGITENLEFLKSNASDIKLPVNTANVVTMRSVLVHIIDKQSVINECYRILKFGGRISIFEPIIKTNTRYYELVDPANFPDYERIKQIEDLIMSDKNDPITNFDDVSLIENFKKARFKDIDIDVTSEVSVYQVSTAMIEPWFNTSPSPGTKTMKQRYLDYLTEEEFDDYIERLKLDLDGKTITVKSNAAYISAVK